MTSSPLPAGTIVVGIDGSVGSDQALGWAVQQADLEHRPLTIAHSTHVAMGGDTLWLGQPGIDVGGLLEDIRVAGHAMLDNAQGRAQRQAPDLEVRQVLSTSDARQALLDLGERAALVVVGSRGRGPIATVLLGSVSVTVAKRATCPVVVVRHAEGTASRGGITVDVDGTEESRAAIEYAYRTASLRSLPLTALSIVWDPAHRGDDEHLVGDGEPGLDDERLLLSEATAAMRAKFPDVQDHLRLVRGLREHQLVRASRGADLLVVGAHRQGVIDDVVFGSVSSVVEHAACDIAVVHGDRSVEMAGEDPCGAGHRSGRRREQHGAAGV